MGTGIETAVAEIIRRSGARMMSPQKGSSACHQFANAEWFGDVIIRAELQSTHHIALLTFRRQHKNWHLQFFRADGATDLEAVKLGQHDIENDQLGMLIERRVESLLTIARCAS